MRGSRKDSKTGPVISFKQQLSLFLKNKLYSLGQTLTCHDSLINSVANKLYFGISIKVGNETGCKSLIDQ